LKEIVFINQDSGYLMIDIVNAHARQGYSCVLLTGRLIERNTPLDPDVKLRRIARYNRNSIFMRVYSWLSGWIQILFLIWFPYRGRDLFIVSNPPLAPLIPLFSRSKYSLLFYDVYIEKPGELSFSRWIKPLVKLWVRAHSRVLRRANHIFTLTTGMQISLEKYSGGKSVRVVPVWSDNSFLKPVQPELNPFRQEHQLEGKFVVLYSGNLGASSGVETLIEVASVTDDPGIIFVLVGDGLRKDALERRAREMELKNLLFLPWQETAVLPYSLASADLAVVSLAGSASKRSIPSKLYNYMSVGAPILCIANADSDLAATVSDFGVGNCFDPALVNEIAEYVRQLSSDSERCKELSRNSLAASESFTPVNAQKFVSN